MLQDKQKYSLDKNKIIKYQGSKTGLVIDLVDASVEESMIRL